MPLFENFKNLILYLCIAPYHFKGPVGPPLVYKAHGPLVIFIPVLWLFFRNIQSVEKGFKQVLSAKRVEKETP